MQFRYFSCPKCGIVMCAPKKRNTKTEHNGQMHRKNMWCPRCKEEQEFVLKEVIDVSNSIFR